MMLSCLRTILNQLFNALEAKVNLSLQVSFPFAATNISLYLRDQPKLGFKESTRL